MFCRRNKQHDRHKSPDQSTSREHPALAAVAAPPSRTLGIAQKRAQRNPTLLPQGQWRLLPRTNGGREVLVVRRAFVRTVATLRVRATTLDTQPATLGPAGRSSCPSRSPFSQEPLGTPMEFSAKDDHRPRCHHHRPLESWVSCRGVVVARARGSTRRSESPAQGSISRPMTMISYHSHNLVSGCRLSAYFTNAVRPILSVRQLVRRRHSDIGLFVWPDQDTANGQWIGLPPRKLPNPSAHLYPNGIHGCHPSFSARNMA